MASSFNDVRLLNHQLTTDCKTSNPETFFHFVGRQASNDNSDLTLSRAAASFCRYTSTANAPLDAIRFWLASLVRRRLSRLTVERYLGRLHSLWLEYSQNKEDEPSFASLRSILSKEDTWSAALPAQALEAAASLLCRLPSLPAAQAPWGSALAFAFYNCSAEFEDLCYLKFSEVDNCSLPTQARELLESLAAPRRQYAFALGQASKRPTQVVREAKERFAALIGTCGFNPGSTLEPDTLRAIWAAAALEVGIAPALLRSVLGHSLPPGYGWLAFLPQQEISPSLRLEILNAVADYLHPTSPNWYALMLRRGSNAERVSQVLETLNPSPTVFYPLREVTHKVGHRLRTISEPVLPGIIFVRSAPQGLKALSAAAGDGAWLLRSRGHEGQYAVIRNSEMAIFQTFLGQAPADATVRLVNNPALQPLTQVRITGGPLAGLTATILRQKNTEIATAAPRTFIVRLTETLGIEFTATLPETLLSEVE